MSTRQHKPSKLRPVLVPLGSLAVLAYFAYHAVEGEYGLDSGERMAAQEVRLRAELRQLTEQRERAEAQVALMRPESLDPDLVDERARHSLNLAHPNDVVLFLSQGASAAAD